MREHGRDADTDVPDVVMFPTRTCYLPNFLSSGIQSKKKVYCNSRWYLANAHKIWGLWDKKKMKYETAHMQLIKYAISTAHNL